MAPMAVGALPDKFAGLAADHTHGGEATKIDSVIAIRGRRAGIGMREFEALTVWNEWKFFDHLVIQTCDQTMLPSQSIS